MDLMKKVFKVTTGYVDEGGCESGNFSSYCIIGTTAEHAIEKAKPMMSGGEFVESVVLVCTIDEE